MRMSDHPDLASSARPIVVGWLLTIAGLLYLGLVTNDPTNPAPPAIILSLPVIYGAVVCFKRGKLRTAQKLAAYAAWLPVLIFAFFLLGIWRRFGLIMSIAGFVPSFIAFKLLSPYHHKPFRSSANLESELPGSGGVEESAAPNPGPASDA